MGNGQIFKINDIDLHTKKNGRLLVRNSDLYLNHGEILVLTGESGIGKSSLIKLLFTEASSSNPNNKVIFHEDYSIKDLGYIPQDPFSFLNPNLKIKQQIVGDSKLVNRSKNLNKERISQLMQQLDLTESERILDSYPYELSSGMIQRILMLNCILLNKKILISDEPTSSLDHENKNRFLSLIRESVKNKALASALIVTHDIASVKDYSDRILEISNHKIVSYSEKTVNLSTRIKDSTNPTSNDNIIDIKNLSIAYPNKNKQKNNIVVGFDFQISKGQNIGITGISGSGKTTLAKILSGTIKYYSKNIAVQGEITILKEKYKFQEKKLQEKFQKTVKMISQNPKDSFNSSLKFRKIINQDIKSLKTKGSERYWARIETLLVFFKLNPEILNKSINEVSGGEAQRISIIRALIHKPTVLILDESFSMIDKKNQNLIIDSLLNIQNKEDISYILISHDHSILTKIATSIISL